MYAFLINRKTNHLEVAASMGLSDTYRNKGPISAVESIPQSLEGPVAISDVMDDPRIQYPEEAKKEGIDSILSVPVEAGGHVLGSLRVYAAKRWDFTLNDVNFVQAMACLTGMAISMARQLQGDEREPGGPEKPAGSEDHEVRKKGRPGGDSGKPARAEGGQKEKVIF